MKLAFTTGEPQDSYYSTAAQQAQINLVRFSTSDFDILEVWLGQIRDSQMKAVKELLVKLKLDSVSFTI